MNAFLDKFSEGNFCCHDHEDAMIDILNDQPVRLRTAGPAFKYVRSEYNHLTHKGLADGYAKHEGSYMQVPEQERRPQKDFHGFAYTRQNHKDILLISVGRQKDIEDVDPDEKAYNKRIGYHDNSLAHELTHYLDRGKPTDLDNSNAQESQYNMVGAFSTMPVFQTILKIDAKADKEKNRLLQRIILQHGYHDSLPAEKIPEEFAIIGAIIYGDKRNSHLIASTTKQFYEGILAAAIQIDSSDLSMPEKVEKRAKLITTLNEGTQMFCEQASKTLEHLPHLPEARQTTLNHMQSEASELLTRVEKHIREELNLPAIQAAIGTPDNTPPADKSKKGRRR